MYRRTFVAATMLLSAGCAAVVPERDPAPPPDSEEWTLRQGVEGSIARDAHQNLVVRDHDFATVDDHARVRGTVRNTRDSAFPGVEVDVTLFSDSDESVGTGSAESEETLEPEGTWRFAVIVENVDVDSVARYEMNTGGESPL